MNKEKELLLQLLLEKYSPDVTVYEKPQIVQTKKRKPPYRWTKHETNTLKILSFERGIETREIAKVMGLPFYVVSGKLKRIKTALKAA